MLTWLLLIAIGLALAGLGVVLTLPVSEYIELQGRIATKEKPLVIRADRDGLFTHLVTDGQLISAGQSIGVLSDPSRDAQGKSAIVAEMAALSEIQDHIRKKLDHYRASADALKEVADREVADTRTALGFADQELVLRAKQVEILRDVIKRHSDLVSRGLLQRSLLDSANRELIDAQGVWLAVSQRVSALKSDIRKQRMEAARSVLEIEQSMEAAEQELLEVQLRYRALQSASSQFLIASTSGWVNFRELASGQVVLAGDEIAIVTPEKSGFEAILTTTAARLGKFDVNSPVLFWLDAFPLSESGQFKGHVTRISRIFVEAPGTAPQETHYDVHVSIPAILKTKTGAHIQLKSGMPLHATIAAGERRLLDWLLISRL